MIYKLRRTLSHRWCRPVPGAGIAEWGTAADVGVMAARAYEAPVLRGLDQSSPKTSPCADLCGPFGHVAVAVAVARPNAARGPAASNERESLGYLMFSCH